MIWRSRWSSFLLYLRRRVVQATRYARDVLWRFFKGSLRIKIITWAFVPTAIILLAVALVNFYAYQRVTEELVIERDQDVTWLSAGRLQTELTKYADLLDGLARVLAAYSGDPLAQSDTLSGASNRLAIFDGGVLFLDIFGTVAATEPERTEILGQDWSDRIYYRQLLRAQISGTPGPIFSDVVPDGLGGTDAIVVAVPVNNEQDEFLGILAGMFRVGAASTTALYGDIVKLRIGESGSIYLLDGNGRVIFHSDVNHIGKDFSAYVVAQRVLDGETGAIRARSLEDHDIVAAFAPVPGTSWGFATEESWSALASGSAGYQRFLVVLLVLGVLVPAVVVAVGTRQIIRPVAELISAAQAVAKGRFGQSIKAQTEDEIGELAKQFNMMSAQLQESYARLEQRVADRTKELAALNTIATVVSRSLDLDEVLTDALNETLEVMGLNTGGICLQQRDTGALTVAVQKGLSASFVAEIDDPSVSKGFTGQVVETGEPLVVKDLASDPGLARQAIKANGFHSMVIVPLVSHGEVLGALFVITRDYREFSVEDIELLGSIGRQVGVTVENAQLFAQVKERMQELEALYRADEELYRHLELDQVLQTLIDVAVDILKADKSSLLVWDEGRERLVVKAARGFSQETMDRMSFALGEGTVGLAAASGEPVIVEDVEADARVVKWVTEPEGIRSFMHFPIKVSDRVFGVFNADYRQPRAYGREEQRLFRALAQRAALAIENAQLYGHAKQVAVLEERQRLARELHDAVTQTLFSASLIAEVLPRIWESDADEGRIRMKELHELTRGALAEMRALLLELRPASLEETELVDLLRQLADSVTGRARVPVTLQVEGECRIPSEVKVVLYRVTQEALNNVVKHAGAGRATVSLHCRNGGVELMIIDDGRGFDPGHVRPDHLGLDIMRERAEGVGAVLSVESRVGQGTRVTVVWRRNTGVAP